MREHSTQVILNFYSLPQKQHGIEYKIGQWLKSWHHIWGRSHRRRHRDASGLEHLPGHTL